MWSTIRYELQNISYIFNDKKFYFFLQIHVVILKLKLEIII